MDKKYIWGGILLLVLGYLGFGVSQNYKSADAPSGAGEKVYVAIEGEGAIGVIDAAQNKMIKTILLTDEARNVSYMPHNVQVSPDGRFVYVTGNAMADMKHQSFRVINVARADVGHEDTETSSDQLIVIDPLSDTIVRRVPVGMNQHLAHVVASPDSRNVFVTAQDADKVYVVDVATMTIERSIALPPGGGPHGERLSPDGKKLYVAFMGGKALGIVDVESGSVETKALDGRVVQTAVAPSGAWVAASIYDSKSVALYDVARDSIAYVELPSESQGPVQLYPTNDSRFVYVADQGALFDRPENNMLYVIDVATQTVTKSIKAGRAPHGVVLSGDNTRAYVTNLKGGTVSVINTEKGKQIAEIPVGDDPNGISVWSPSVGTPAPLGMLSGMAMTVYKSPTCGCCGNYIAELKRQGASVVVEELSDEVLAVKKKELGIAPELESCHTALLDGYVVEGHVPMAALLKLHTERPDIKGIALPGMPAGSPGMSGMKMGAFKVRTLDGGMFGEF